MEDFDWCFLTDYLLRTIKNDELSEEDKKIIEQDENAIKELLDDEHKKLVDHLSWEIMFKLDDLYLCTSNQLVCKGVRIGMQLQKAFDKMDEM
ncbi:MAG: hypothetical protein E7351_00125 [Clostridiales bacterium]|nr:hypothetical protein [Clostridiales bacterium]